MNAGAWAIVDLLVGRYAFGEVSAAVAEGLITGPDHRLAQIQQLCAFGQRLLDLDAEDFGEPDAATDANVDHAVADRVHGDAVPAPLVRRSLAARMPQSPYERNRGALGSLRPAFALWLEVIGARWARRQTSPLVATLHIISEYLPLLAWEPMLGHAADPLRMPASVAGLGSRWGELDDDVCPHSRTLKSAAGRSLRVAGEPDAGWQSYLDRQHSLVSAALGFCAAQCRTPCSVLTRHPRDERAELESRCRTAQSFTDSALIQLRHSAPVGHGFGVPSRREVLDVWMQTRGHLGAREPAVLEPDGFVLPGLPSLLSTLAGAPITPDTLIADTAAELHRALRTLES